MEDAQDLETFPLEIQQHIINFLATLDKAHFSLVSKKCAEAVFSEPQLMKEKDQAIQDKQDIDRTIIALNEKITSNGYQLTNSFSFYCEKINKTNIKYYDNSLVLLRMESSNIGKTPSLSHPFLITVLRNEFNKIGTKELNEFSTYGSYDYREEKNIINSLKKGAKKREEYEEAVKLLTSLYPENNLLKSLIVVPKNNALDSILFSHFDCETKILSDSHIVSKKSFTPEDPELLIVNNFFEQLRKNEVIKTDIFEGVIDDNFIPYFSITIEIPKFDKFKEACQNWKKNTPENQLTQPKIFKFSERG